MLPEEGEEADMSRQVTARELRQKRVALHGSVDFVIEEIMKIKEVCGDDDLMFNAWFEHGGFSSSEIEDQMMCFAENVMPVLPRECGGSPEQPVSSVELVPEVRVTARVS